MLRYRDDDDGTMTVLDKLFQPVKSGEIGTRSRNALRDSIARDLEMLLNTHRQDDFIPAEYVETIASIVTFGVPEFTAFGNLSSAIEQNKLCKAMEEAIRIYEPRLGKVSVRMAASEDRKALLRFRLEATIEFLSEREVFEMGFKRDTGEMTVLTGRNA
jgi:type VI secretion system lysozyme-like protein